MKLSFAAVVLTFAAATVQGFTVLPSVRTLTRLSLMTPEETEAILKRAEQCADSECGLEDVSELVNVLKSQQKELYDRVEKIKKTVDALEKVNKEEDRPVDEIRETVRAIFRVFQLGDKASGNDYPALSKPTGYSGDVGDGPQTAWDALPPKKWKASP